MNNNPNIDVIKVGKTGLFTNYLYKAIPLAFDDSMSYYECLCGLLNYLQNTVIPAVNNNADAVIELQGLFEDLHDYVEHYFDNLNVQTEINNKLDTMVADGTMDDIVNRLLDPYEEIINQRVADVEELSELNSTNIATQTSRIDNLATLTEGSTTGDAELIDGRTSFTGQTFSNIGNNIRSFGKGMFTNIISTLTKTEGAYVNAAFNQNPITGYDNYKLPTKKGYLYYISCEGLDNGTTISRPQIMFAYNKMYPTDLQNSSRTDPIIIQGDGSTIYVNNKSTFTPFIGELNVTREFPITTFYNDITSDVTTVSGSYIGKTGNIGSSASYSLISLTPTIGKKYIVVTGVTTNDVPIYYQQNGEVLLSSTSNDVMYGCFEVTAKNTNTLYFNRSTCYDPCFKIYESKETSLVQVNSNINRTCGLVDNAVFCGDSLTYGQTYTGVNTAYHNYYNYPYFVKKLMNLNNITEYAQSGANATSWWSNFSNNITATNTIYFVWLGTNSTFTDTVATDCDGDDYTQYAETETGYMGKILGKINSLDGNKIVLLNVFRSAGNVNTNNKVINDFATKFNAIVVDTYNSDARTNMNYHISNNHENNVHFNSVGNNYVANLVVNKIQQVMDNDPLTFEMYKEY